MPRASSASAPLVEARVTGLVGVLMLASGSFAGTVAARLIVRDDVVATSRNLVASESLFRLGLASSLVMMVAFLFYGLLLYRLLGPVDRGQGLAMVALVAVSVPIYMLNQVHQFAALRSAQDQLYDRVQLFLDLHALGSAIAAIFFGLWLFPLGLLVFRSGYYPRPLGLLLMLGSPGYLVLFVQSFFFPASQRTLWSNPLLWVTHAAELAMMSWLLIRGLDADRWKQRALECV